MSISIGIRSKPDAVYYCVLRDSEADHEILVLDRIILPKSLSIPEQLKFVRSTLLDILNEYHVLKACIRITESSAQSITTKRIYLEGIIQELLASSPVQNYSVGEISSLSSKLRIDRKEFKPFAEGKYSFRDIPDWKSWDLESRESVLAAFAALA